MIKLIKAILTKNEESAYTQLANVKWKKEVKVCHYKDEAKLSYFMHAVQSKICAWYFFKIFIFCAVWHPLFPNIKPHYATEKLAEFNDWYANLNRKLHVCKWKTKKKVENINPFSQIL